MNIIEVNSKKDKKDFIQIACSIYKNEKNWIRPLDKDINSVFDPKTNKAFRKGDVKRWILKNNNETIGRIAAFYSSKNDNEKLRVGGCGFFECIDDKEAAKMLFDTAKNWLEKNGYNSMDGPINFGERDKWWGCLVEGFDIDPNYLQNYGKAYYQKLFENYGFQLLFRQLTFLKKVRTPLSEKLSLKAERALRDPNYNFKTLEKRNIQTRVVFTGNIVRQPMCRDIKKRVTEKGYPNADNVMARGILLPLHHGLTEDMFKRFHSSVEEFVEKNS